MHPALIVSVLFGEGLPEQDAKVGRPMTGSSPIDAMVSNVMDRVFEIAYCLVPRAEQGAEDARAVPVLAVESSDRVAVPSDVPVGRTRRPAHHAPPSQQYFEPVVQAWTDAKNVIENWRRYYNTRRPHSSCAFILGYRPTTPEMVLWPASPSGAASPATPTVAQRPVML